MATKRQQGTTEGQNTGTSDQQLEDMAVEAPEETRQESAIAWEESGSTATEVASEEGSEEGSEEATLQIELEQARQQMMRVQADFDNFRKRTRQEKEDLQLFATRKVLADLLPVLDNFDRALSALAGSDVADEIRTGMVMVQRQLLSVLENGGVTSMDVVGQSFDPNLHEGVMQMPADGQEVGIIVQELQKGYWIHGKVLRPAMVAVST